MYGSYHDVLAVVRTTLQQAAGSLSTLAIASNSGSCLAHQPALAAPGPGARAGGARRTPESATTPVVASC